MFATCGATANQPKTSSTTISPHGTRESDGGEKLCSGGGRLRKEPQLAGRPVFKHVAANRVGIMVPAPHPQEDIFQGHSKSDSDTFLPVIGKKPVLVASAIGSS